MSRVNTETSHLFRIYAAIDQQVSAHPEIAEQVSALLPAYEYSGAHWADAFPDWAGTLTVADDGGEEDGTEGLSLLENSLEQLGPPALKCRLPARRVYAVGAAGLAFREHLEPGLEREGLKDKFRNALTFPGIAGNEADELLEVVLDDSLLKGPHPGTSASIARWWNRVLKKIPSIDGIEADGAIGPAPCSTGLVWVELAGDEEPAATFTTEFDVEMSYAKALAFCDPEKWRCFALWCDMQKTGETHRNGHVVHQFLETVSLNCGEPDSTQIFEIKLDFVTNVHIVKDEDGHDRHVSVTEYRLSEDDEGERVLVNAGSLVITELSDTKVRIKTTKRLKFSEPLDGPSFASVLCHLGYTSFVEDLICCATAGEDWDAAWPGYREPPPRKPQSTSPWVDPEMVGLTKATIRRTETALTKWLDGYEKAYNRSARRGGSKAHKGCYTLGDLLEDTTGMWRVAMCEAPNIMDFGLRSAPVTPDTPERGAARAARYSR